MYMFLGLVNIKYHLFYYLVLKPYIVRSGSLKNKGPGDMSSISETHRKREPTPVSCLTSQPSIFPASHIHTSHTCNDGNKVKFK